MKTLHQSPSLQVAFQKQVNKKISTNRQAAYESLEGSFWGSVGMAMFEFKQVENKFKGSLGEWGVSLLLKSLPDTWVMFNNALIPTTNSGTLTEIDHLIIGSGGVFLVEVKTWSGSFSAYNDKWKRREGNNWVAISNSPTSQSVYHQRMFSQWITSFVRNLTNGLITAPVVFPIAKWIGTNNCSVPVLLGVPALQKMLIGSPACLTPTQVQEIVKAVENYTIPVKTAQAPLLIPKPKPIKRQNQMPLN